MLSGAVEDHLKKPQVLPFYCCKLIFRAKNTKVKLYRQVLEKKKKV